MSEKKPITTAMSLAAECAKVFGLWLSEHDVRRHPELTEIYFSCVFKEIGNEKSHLDSFKENSGSNSREAIDWLMKQFYKFYKDVYLKLFDAKKTDKSFPKYYLDAFVGDLRNNRIGKLTHPIKTEYSNGDSVDWDSIDKELSSLVCPCDFVNNTKFVGVKTYDGRWRIGHDNVERLSYDDIEFFKERYRGKNLDDYIMIYVPPFGYRFYEKKNVNNKKVFVLTAEQRRYLILLLTRRNMDLFQKYVDVFKRKPIETEYELFLYYNNRDHYVGVQQWFDHEIYCFENPLEETTCQD